MSYERPKQLLLGISSLSLAFKVLLTHCSARPTAIAKHTDSAPGTHGITTPRWHDLTSIWMMDVSIDNNLEMLGSAWYCHQQRR